MKWLFSFFFVLLLFVPSNVLAATYPDYTGYVNDYAGVLSSDYSSQLNAKLALFNKKTTNQIAVVTVNSTQPETIEEYGIHLADKWKVGQSGKDNGLIMIYAIKDHHMRIEVGRGLEGDITDIQSKHIQAEVIAPAFKQGNYEKGIENGVNAVINTITHDASYAGTLKTDQTVQNPRSNTSTSLPLVLIIIVIIVILIALSIFTPFGGIAIWILLSLLNGGEGGGGNNEKDNGGSDKFGGGGFSGGGSSDSW